MTIVTNEHGGEWRKETHVCDPQDEACDGHRDALADRAHNECVTCANGHAPMTPTENARACDMHTIRLDRNATCPQCLRTLTTSEYGAASILANRPCLKCQITSQARR